MFVIIVNIVYDRSPSLFETWATIVSRNEKQALSIYFFCNDTISVGGSHRRRNFDRHWFSSTTDSKRALVFFHSNFLCSEVEILQKAISLDSFYEASIIAKSHLLYLGAYRLIEFRFLCPEVSIQFVLWIIHSEIQLVYLFVTNTTIERPDFSQFLMFFSKICLTTL